MFNGLHSEIHSITVFPSEEVRTSAVQTGVTGVRCVKGRGGGGVLLGVAEPAVAAFPG